MNNTSRPRSTSISHAQSVLEQHKELHQILDKLDAALAVIPSAEARSQWLGALDSDLSRLVPQLEAHFSLEEQGELFEEIQEALPETSRTCEELRADHDRLLKECGDLREAVELAQPEEESIKALASRCRELLRVLAAHEDAENDLLYRAVGDEIGAQD